MTQHSFPGLARISARKAKNLWGKTKQTISLCPAKLRPDGPWRPNIDIFPAEQAGRDFDKTINEFIYYNCQQKEAGYYPAFYLRA